MKKDRLLCFYGFLHAWLITGELFLLGQSLAERFSFISWGKALFFWFPIVLLYREKEKGKNLINYLLAWALAFLGAWFLGSSAWEKGWLLGLTFCLGILYLKARLDGIPGILERAHYPWLALFLAIYLYDSFLGEGFLREPALFGAGAYWLLLLWQGNREEFLKTCQESRSLYRFDSQKLALTSRFMLGLVSGLTLAGMLIFPFLGADRLLGLVGKLFRWMLTRLFSGSQETIQEETTGESSDWGDFSLGEELREPSAFWETLSEIFTFLFQAALIVGAVFLLCWVLFWICRKYGENLEKNGDIQERLVLDKGERRETLRREKREKQPLFARSQRERIRRIYKRKLLEAGEGKVRTGRTPWELEEDAGFSDSCERREFHRIYERARYGEEPVKKEEAARMKELDRVDFSEEIV